MTADIQTLLSAFFGKNPNSLNDLKKKTQGTTDSNDLESPGEKELDEKPEEPVELPEEESGKKSEEETDQTKETEETTESEGEKKPEEQKSEEKEGEGETEKKQENKEETETTQEPAKTEDVATDDKPSDNKSEDSMPESKEIDEIATEKSEEGPEFKDNMYLANYFFSFLEKKELNVTLVGYFCRFLNHLIIKRLAEVKISFSL